MKIIHYGVRDDVRMCHMVDPIFALDDQDFFYRDVSPLLLAQPQQKTRKSTHNKSLISGIAPGTFYCGANGALGVAIGASCCCE